MNVSDGTLPLLTSKFLPNVALPMLYQISLNAALPASYKN
jgi:hypothetical protein